jgi:Histidine kinase-, DNA gyrase B-, and HSP90-like ATPase
VGETRVDLQHLLEDLRDAYSGALEETILTEVVANALDSGARRIRILTNPAAATLTVGDDGRGMQRRELARYHDVAASTKSRGQGIGFAGVGIKLGLLVSREVVTETRRGATHVATRWHLQSRHRAPWKWIPPPGLTGERGTAVLLTLENQLSPLVDAGYIEEAIRRHFEPLLDPAFDDLLKRHYSRGIVFEVDGRPLSRADATTSERVPISIRLGRRRAPSALGYLERHGVALPDDRQGIAISTFGKVIKRGWDWLGLTPAAPARTSGLIEAPDLAACLTLSKNDFIRTGARGASYLAYRKAIQEVVSRQFAAWGDARDADARPRTMRLERDLERVLEDLSDEFPLLRSLVDRRAGGQKRLPLPGRGDEMVPGTLFANVPAMEEVPGEREEQADVPAGAETAGPESPGEGQTPRGSSEEPRPREELPPTDRDANAGGATATDAIATVGTLSTVPGRRRPARYGLLVQFESRPGDTELGRLVDSTIWINEAHPAYTRATASRSTGYHIALSVALALAPLAVETRDEHAFITQFLALWGGAQGGGPGTRRRRRKR